MFFIQTFNRTATYTPGEKWSQVAPIDPNSDKEERQQADDESESKRQEFNFFEYVKPLESSPRKLEAKLMVSAFMSAPVVTFSQDMPLKEARQAFLRHNYSHIPVVNKEGEILGVVGQKDLFSDDSKGGHVADVMRQELLFADQEVHLVEIAQVFFENELKWMPIVDKRKRVVGVVTRDDLFKTALKLSHIKPT